MPKKRQDKALLIKPGSKSSTSSTPPRQHETEPTVNDLIRESRRLQLKNEPSTSTPLTASVPPHLRTVLNLPTPLAPTPRAGTRASGPLRLRRIPGPPPPRSWLIDSRHAPSSELTVDYHGRRVQARTSTLPGDLFPAQGSLQHMTLKELAVNWDWHAVYDGIYLSAMLPTPLKESLLSYIAVYNDEPTTNPLRLLFLCEEEADSRNEVTRLDLTGGIGTWTNLKQLTADLARNPSRHHPIKETVNSSISSPAVPTSWDNSDSEEEPQPTPLPHPSSPKGPVFKNLKHLSLALTPGKSASWKDLIHLTSHLSTLTSLSLASWPQPTYTPLAAATRTILKPPSNLPATVYGGSNFYTAHDNDWREAAGILRTLSRTLYCLKWLDLTGCGGWFGALTWEPDEETASASAAGPEWNGSWRGVEHVCLSVGWTPISPDISEEGIVGVEEDDPSKWDIQAERRKYYHRKEVEKHGEIRRTAEAVVQHLRSLRKRVGGRWIEFEL
jgi:hypothetical protein